MIIKRLFFLYQNSTELDLIKFIIDLLPSNIKFEKYIFCVDTPRIEINSLKNSNFNIIFIEEISYSLNQLVKGLKKRNSLKNILNSLQISENDIFFTQPLFSLNNFILYRYFHKSKSKIISFALNSTYIKNNKYFKIDPFLSLKRSFYTFIFSRKLVYYFTIKNFGSRNMHFVFTKTNSNIHLDMGPSIKNEMINSTHVLKFENAPLGLKINQSSNNILLLIKSHKSEKIFGFSEEKYLNKIHEIVYKLKSMSFFVFVKNHPASSISEENLAKKIGVPRKNILDKKIDFEQYLKIHCNNYRYILTDESNTALTLQFYGINYYTINELLTKGSSLYSNIYKLNILYNLSDLNKRNKRKFNRTVFLSKKSLFKKYIEID